MNLRTRHTPEPAAGSDGGRTALLLQRAIEAHGGYAASWTPESGEGRLEEATVRPATLVSDESVRHYRVPDSDGWPDPVAFMDGIQQYRVVGYLGTSPVVLAEVAAGVRVRRGGRLSSGMALHQRMVIARSEHLELLAGAFQGAVPVPLPDDVVAHPLRDRLAAARAVEQRRAQLEVQVSRDFRSGFDGWLIVDGSLSESIDWAGDPRMVGVVKSHATLPFEGADQENYLRTPACHRSSVFRPQSRTLAPVVSWGLRLWPWEGLDLMYGLVRVELSAEGAAAEVDTVSSWLLAERAPISGRDARWDRLLYGIHDVERWLRARQHQPAPGSDRAG